MYKICSEGCDFQRKFDIALFCFNVLIDTSFFNDKYMYKVKQSDRPFSCANLHNLQISSSNQKCTNLSGSKASLPMSLTIQISICNLIILCFCFHFPLPLSSSLNAIISSQHYFCADRFLMLKYQILRCRKIKTILLLNVAGSNICIRHFKVGIQIRSDWPKLGQIWDFFRSVQENVLNLI